MHSGPDLPKLYRNRFEPKTLARKRGIWKVICHDFLQRFIGPHDTVLDLACGYGEFINAIRSDRKIAIDLNEDSRGFVDPGVDFRLMPATRVGDLGSGIADVVFCSNFLEHLPDRATLELLLDQVATVLNPGGRFLILGPNLRYLPGRYWDFYDHQLGLTHLSLAEVLRLHGFHLDLCLDRFLPYTTKTALPTHPLLVRLYLRLPLVWRVMGRQFFLAASTEAAKSESK